LANTSPFKESSSEGQPTQTLDPPLLEGGRVYFINSGSDVGSVPSGGGTITTHVNGDFSHVYHANGQLFLFSGALYSVPDTAVGITTLASSSFPLDIASDENMVYWSEHGRVLMTPMRPSIQGTDSPVGFTPPATPIFSASDPRSAVRLVLDGTTLFISDGLAGNIHRIDLSTGSSRLIASSITAGPNAPFDSTLPLVVTDHYLYTLVNNRDIVEIDKTTGATFTVISTYSGEGKIRADRDGVYWWLADYPGIRLMRIDSRTRTISTVLQAPNEIQYTDDVADFFSDGSDIWWMNRTYTPQGDGLVKVQHVPVGGGSPVVVETLDAMSLGTNFGIAPRYLTGDRDHLYWLCQTNAVAKLPKTGGTPVILGWNVSAVLTAFHATATDLIWGEGGFGLLRTMPKEGQAVPTLLWPSDPNEPRAPNLAVFTKGVVFDGTSLYWMRETYDTSTALSYTEIFSFSVSDGSIRNLGKYFANAVGVYPYSANKIFAASDYLFVSVWSPNGYTLTRIPRGGGDPVDVMTTGDVIEPVDIYVNQSIAYIALNSFAYAYKISTGELNQLNLPPFSPNKIYVDDTHIYWTEGSESSPSGGVYRMSLADGAQEIGYEGTASQITGDEEFVYWVSGASNFKLPK
jgi:hypothetical protein